jgi:predicted DNA-binding protein YlxM (UPF0122 family)
MANPTVPLQLLMRLYCDEKLSVAETAARVGMNRNSVYSRFKNNGISLRTEVSKEELRELYEDQRLTIKAIAKRTGLGKKTVAKLLDRYEIPRSFRKPSNHSEMIKSIPVGGQIEIVNTSVNFPKTIRALARILGIRIVVRRLDEMTFLIDRTPDLNPEVVLQMLNEGMSITKIAETFLTTRAAIVRRLP